MSHRPRGRVPSCVLLAKPILTHYTFSNCIINMILYYLLSVQCNTLHGTEYKITCGVFLCVCVRAHRFWGPNISKTVRDRGSVTMGHQ